MDMEVNAQILVKTTKRIYLLSLSVTKPDVKTATKELTVDGVIPPLHAFLETKTDPILQVSIFRPKYLISFQETVPQPVGSTTKTLAHKNFSLMIKKPKYY